MSTTQQQTIDLAINSYLRTNDNTARQYLKLRQDVLELTQKIIQQDEVDSETASRLEKLKFEYAKVRELYSAHVNRISNSLQLPLKRLSYPSELDPQIAELEEKKQRIESETESLKTTKKPIVEKIKQLGSRYETGATVKSSRSLGSAKFISHASKPSQTSTFLDQDSSIFSRTEIEGLFVDVKAKLASLKTVDEITDENEELPAASSEPAPSININKYLDEVLQGNRAYTRLEGDRYRYDISKSTAVDVGNANKVIDEYKEALDATIRDIQGLVVRGTEAKERWLSNAKVMEMIQSLLEDNMEID